MSRVLEVAMFQADGGFTVPLDLDAVEVAIDRVDAKVAEVERIVARLERLFFGKEPEDPVHTPRQFQKALALADSIDPEHRDLYLRREMLSLAAPKLAPEGLPLTIEGLSLTLHPKHPFRGRRQVLLPGLSYGDAEGEARAAARKAAEQFKDNLAWELSGRHTRNTFWSRRLRRHVLAVEEGGKVTQYMFPDERDTKRRFELLMSTFTARAAWTPAAEAKAREKLAGLLSEEQRAQFALTDSFIEQSPRSRVWYVFRHLRPTVAVTRTGRLLCTLCLHPVGYYQDTWAGVLCPTDDLITHLLMMRGDEHLFWKRANQHPGDRPESGL